MLDFDVSTSGKDWLKTGDFKIIRGKKSEPISYAEKDSNEEDLYEKYGVNWNKDYKIRCLKCKNPLKNSTFGYYIFFCSSCNEKHVLQTDDGEKLNKKEARDLLVREAMKFFK